MTNAHARWTSAEDAYLREHYATLTRAEIRARLGRSLDAISYRAGQLGIRTPNKYTRSPRIAWLKKALRLRQRLSYSLLAERAGLSRKSVERYAAQVRRGSV